MNRLLRSAAVIARRDYVATVWSKTFLLFLLGPLFPIAFGVLFGGLSAQSRQDAARSSVAVVADKPSGEAIRAARARLVRHLGERTVPELRIVPPEADRQGQVERLLGDERATTVAVLIARGDRPLMFASKVQFDALAGKLALILEEARQGRASHAAALPPITIQQHSIERMAVKDDSGRLLLARIGQTLLVLLVMILAGMLLSNLIEEKSSKVIEVLAAAVPIDAIFMGKLSAMLAMSLTGITVWAGAGAMGALLFLGGDMGALPAPAVGWPAFVVFGILYFATSYLLIGALFLGIGGQASTVREVQTLSMPLTMGQLLIFALASAAIGDANGPAGMAAALFPWSSPFAMIARAAEFPELWPHLLAIVWQGLWLALIIRVASRLFRTSVLKSGGGPRRSLFARLGWKR
jgi:ABC-2 type transport system permease protein